ncbi:hypothetical protein [Lysinibacillus boronitolerans]|uniref:hypothetical protein n=1 Tax=Lysinibacillus boronitolerans TaxID=309788 RepID=UPI000FFC0D82|nr:hypothetical protein [Lysinibacillus boronitolerans]MCS1391220.1 hypothetical protein [Lysinibacillus boronitolerans]
MLQLRVLVVWHYGVILPFMQEGLSLTTIQSGYLGTMLFLGYVLTVGLSGALQHTLVQKMFC